jgi:hypothetical protein
MPYSTEELKTLEFYQELARKDESKYRDTIKSKTISGHIDGTILRNQSGNIILFEKIIPGQGTDGTSHTENHTLSYEDGYWIYEENEELDKIIKREFTEF